jgi:hypothetical protein
MPMTRKQLERAAIAAHRDGTGWPEFWDTHAADIVRAEPWDREGRRKLVTRLSLLVTAGDLDGQRPAGDWWEDAAPPAYPATDHSTVARLLWQPTQEA